VSVSYIRFELLNVFDFLFKAQFTFEVSDFSIAGMPLAFSGFIVEPSGDAPIFFTLLLASPPSYDPLIQNS